jgi:hypothetical protein
MPIVTDGASIAECDSKILIHKSDPSAHHVKFDIFDKFRDFEPWVSLDGWTVEGDAGYYAEAYANCVAIGPTNISGSEVWLYSHSEWSLLLETGKVVTVEFVVDFLSDSILQIIWLTIISPWTPSGDPDKDNHFGWKIIGADLYTSNADGVTQTITDTGIDMATGEQRTRLKIVLNPGTDCKFYVNDVLKVTHTTNLPSADPYVNFYTPAFGMKTLDEGLKLMGMERILVEREN